MRYIVDFHNDAPQQDIDNYLVVHSCTVLKEWNNFDKIYLVEAPVEPPVTEIVAFVKDDSHLVIKPMTLVDINPYFGQRNPNYPTVVVSTTDEKDWWKNYSLAKPVFDEPTTTISKKGSHVHVYIMDSGINSDHPEFEGVDISYVYSVTPNDYTDNRGHGTALASVISGNTCGITTAKLKIVKIYDTMHQTLQSEFMDALDAVLEDVPDNSFAILNCSWSIPKNEWVEYKLRELQDKGVWTFAAAGNSGTTIEDVTPAAMPEAFTVGAYGPDLKPCDFSDYTGPSEISLTNSHTNGGELDGWAPGEKIWAALLGGGYGYIAGTSVACAIATAAAAHNLNDYIGPDGKAYPAGATFSAGPDAYRWVLVSRPDLLDLSDPKYADSTNSIITLFDFPDTTMPPDHLGASVRVGEDEPLIIVFSPHHTKSFEILTPLPENFCVLPYGMLRGAPTAEQGPQNGEAYKLYTFKFKRVSNDDVEEIITVDVYVLSANFKPEDVPPDDPVIPITLLAGCQLTTGCFLNQSTDCVNNCIAYCCDGSSFGSIKVSMFCFCSDSYGET